MFPLTAGVCGLHERSQYVAAVLGAARRCVPARFLPADILKVSKEPI